MKVAVLLDVEVPGFEVMDEDEQDEVRMDIVNSFEDRDAEVAFEDLIGLMTGLGVAVTVLDYKEPR